MLTDFAVLQSETSSGLECTLLSESIPTIRSKCRLMTTTMIHISIDSIKDLDICLHPKISPLLCSRAFRMPITAITVLQHLCCLIYSSHYSRCLFRLLMLVAIVIMNISFKSLRSDPLQCTKERAQVIPSAEYCLATT